jgi:hypothetical protein
MNDPAAKFEIIWLGDIRNTSAIPTEGKNLAVIARLQLERLLHVRVFDGNGEAIVDADEVTLCEKHGFPFRRVIDTAQAIESVDTPDEIRVEVQPSPPTVQGADQHPIEPESNAPLVGWGAGARAQLEIFQNSHDGNVFSHQSKHALPWGTTIRPPVELFAISTDLPRSMKDIDQKLKAVDNALRAVEKARADYEKDKRNQADKEVTARAEAVLKTAIRSARTSLSALGNSLYRKMLPSAEGSADYMWENVFLDIGIDEDLLKYPWELMFNPDGGDFLCMNNYTGRFVNTKRGIKAPFQVRGKSLTQKDKLRVLLISVPRSEIQGYTDRLEHVDTETSNIEDAFKRAFGKDWQAHLKILGKNEDADWESVNNELAQAQEQKKVYHIIHFCGHASNDAGLILYNKPFGIGDIENFGMAKPILCVINACNSAAANATGNDRFDHRGLAKPFLETGAYFLGSRLKVGDRAAAKFAADFYDRLIVESRSIGEAVSFARKSCRGPKEDPSANFEWTSYVYYGDPRLRFPRVRSARANSEDRESP